MKIVHAADLHLDSPLRGLSEYEGAPSAEIRAATRRALVALVDLCVEVEAALLLIAGDLYDGDFKDYSTALYFTEQMSRLRATGTQVVWLRGNHDAANRITKHLRSRDHVFELSSDAPQTYRFEELGVAVHGRGYWTRDVRENLARSYPEPDSDLVNIGLLHTALDGREGHALYAPCSVPDLKERGYDYWALGHVHQREVLCEDPWIVFPGNLQGRHIRETGPKGATLLSIESGKIVSVEPRVLDQVRWERTDVDVSEADSVDEVLDRVVSMLDQVRESAGGRVLATRVRLLGSTPLHAQLIHERERIEHEILAHAVDQGDIYLEKVQMSTFGKLSVGSLAGRHDALGELFSTLGALKQDDGGKKQLLEELLRPITGITPDLLKDDSLDSTELLEDVHRLLEGYLLAEGREGGS